MFWFKKKNINSSDFVETESETCADASEIEENKTEQLNSPDGSEANECNKENATADSGKFTETVSDVAFYGGSESEGRGELAVRNNKLPGRAESQKQKGVDFSPLFELARILNISVEQVKDECCMFQVRNLMSKLGKVIVRFNVTDGELDKITHNCAELKIGEVLLSPAYLNSLLRRARPEELKKLNVGTIIDFPFGESNFKSKQESIKEAVKLGVDGITVMLPAMLLESQNIKTFKKQAKKIGRMYKNRVGIALSAMEISGDMIKTAIRTAEKSKLSHITFIFGEATEKDLKLKFKTINKYKSKKPVKILGNVENIEAVVELFKMGVETILTPFANELGESLVKRFQIKSLKLR